MKQSDRILVCVVSLLLLASTAVMMISCSGGSSGNSGSSSAGNTYYGTQSPGDAWTWTITTNSSGNGTFSATDTTTGYTYSGTVATLSNDFLQLTYTASTDSNVTVGSTAYAVQLPATALLVLPAGANTSVVIAAAQGSCPSPANYNWVTVANQSWALASDPAFGTAQATGSASSFTLTVNPYLQNATALTSFSYSASCTNGVITATSASNGNATFGITPSGAFIGDQGTNGGIAGMLQPPSDIGSTGLLQAGRQFRGFIFMTHPPSNGTSPGEQTYQANTQPIWATTTGNGLLTGGEYVTSTDQQTNDLVNGVADTCPGGNTCVDMSFTTEVSPGAFNGTMTDPTGAQRAFTLLVNQINGKYMVFGFSLNQLDTGGAYIYPDLFLVMEQ